MDIKNLKQQLHNAKKLASEIENQNRIFDDILQETVKGVDDTEKPVVESLIALSQRALNLAKKGEGDKAQQLIKDFKIKNGGQSNK